ncbi:MAG: class I SAM-dependent methyltransferase [Paludibacter sp.]|jgi:ubiquinone/menaquinone biosynthesis C-methylase UbiE|nr:class I SAM-dependent methyltransferase [Paludibacter sp.]
MDNTDNKKFWNRFAFLYDLKVNMIKTDKLAYKLMIENVRKELNADMEVLELATGTGLIAVKIADACKRIEATDFSPNMIETAKAKGCAANLTFCVQDATNLTYADKTFDAVIISNALHIMPNPEKALANISRVLKDDGILIAPTFTRSNKFSEKLKAGFMGIFGFKTYSKWTFDQYLQFIEQNEWKITKKDCIKASFPLAYLVAKK